MSTLTQAQPGTAVPPRLLSVPLAVTFLAEFTSLTSFFLLLSVMPMLAAAGGAGSSGAGLITGALLLGTVAAEAVAAAAIRRFGYRMVLAAGAVLLGAPALAMLTREPQAVMVSVSLVRGLGFGLSGVVTGALTATAAASRAARRRARPARRRVRRPGRRRAAGRGLARRTPPGLRSRGDGGHRRPAAAGGDPLAAGRARGPAPPAPDGGQAPEAGRMAGAALRLPLIFAAVTIAAGVLDSFLPLAKGIPSNLSSATCSSRRSPPHSAAGRLASMATGMVTPGCSSRRSPWRRSAWPR